MSDSEYIYSIYLSKRVPFNPSFILAGANSFIVFWRTTLPNLHIKLLIIKIDGDSERIGCCFRSLRCRQKCCCHWHHKWILLVPISVHYSAYALTVPVSNKALKLVLFLHQQPKDLLLCNSSKRCACQAAKYF